MALAPEKLRIFAFPQRVEDNLLDVNVLLLPTQRLLNIQDPFNSQLNPPGTVRLPRFIKAKVELSATLIKGMSSYPFSNAAVLAGEGVTTDPLVTNAQFPPDLPVLYEALLTQFKLDDPNSLVHTQGAEAAKPESHGIRKYLPRSYRAAFNFTTPRTDFAKTDDSYQCAFKNPFYDPAFKPSKDFVTWGRIISFCLRQPLLAKRIGLIHEFRQLELPEPDYFKNGGWIYFNLTSPLNEFDITNPATELKLYAARIPEIDGNRQVFAAMVFPVVPGPALPNGQYDVLLPETADYDDGFAKIVHAFQPVSANLLSEEPDGIHVQKDAGIRLGWDDEQLLIWQNRQVLADPTTPGARIDAPLGVSSYRIDVREKTQPESAWASLVRLRNRKDLTLGGELVAPAQTEQESGVQVYPTRLNADPATFYWLPSYFSQWYGASLVCPDEKAAQLDKSGSLNDPGAFSSTKIPATGQEGGLYEPLLPQDPELKYGTQYEFRVRLSDLSGGGPTIDDDEINDAPANSAFIRFQRFIAPKQLTLKPKTPQSNPNSRTAVFLEGTLFDVFRPRLGYPALLFTEMDTADAFQKLKEDRDFLHKGKVGLETIKEQRDVSYFDPDVEQILITVELRTLLLDNGASFDKSEAFIPLYTTLRRMPDDPKAPFTLELEYRDANVIDFGNPIDLGDLGLSQPDIDNNPEIVLPRSRDIRITLYPVCPDKPAKPSYFGFEQTRFGGELFRTGELIQFFVREDADNEVDFFKTDLESNQLQAIYLRPDEHQVIRPLSFIADVVEGKELAQSTLIQRLATEIDVDYKGMTLMGKRGERIQFGCSNRLRHTLAPDGSSLTFSTKDDLINHWLCVLSFEIQRDWTWDGLSESGVTIRRTKRFTGEAVTQESADVGAVRLIKTATRIATTKPDRSYTRIVFIDAVEPKKDVTKPAVHQFPNTIDLSYEVKPHFINSVTPAASDEESVERECLLPVTNVPKQVPKIVAAGIALSPYQHNARYSETAVRERYLWFEFEEPIADPNDTYFARVLAYAPDPLLTFPNPDQVEVIPEDPPLPISPELIRVVTAESINDNAGIDAMQEMTAETPDPGQPLVKLSPVHYLLPLPPGLHNESNDLFGFFTYELRVGHTDRIWSTAQGRFGHPMRVTGVQHPAPPLKCLVDRTPKGITVTAQYATAVFSGKNVTSKPPKTEIWCMLYAQVKQADGHKNRNILLSELKLDLVQPKQDTFKLMLTSMVGFNLDAPATAVNGWTEAEIRQLLEDFRLARTTGLSVLAVEMMPRYDQYFLFSNVNPDTSIRPLSQQLGQYRILRTSRLVAAPEIC